MLKSFVIILGVFFLLCYAKKSDTDSDSTVGTSSDEEPRQKNYNTYNYDQDDETDSTSEDTIYDKVEADEESNPNTAIVRESYNISSDVFEDVEGTYHDKSLSYRGREQILTRLFASEIDVMEAILKYLNHGFINSLLVRATEDRIQAMKEVQSRNQKPKFKIKRMVRLLKEEAHDRVLWQGSGAVPRHPYLEKMDDFLDGLCTELFAVHPKTGKVKWD
uniref:Uncharacterized protein n=1 Tax=Clastoptera arizonana TaxID=38151 RepID=A0A1B6E4E9_9HEMI